MHPTYDTVLAQRAYQSWRMLRNETLDHNPTCPCTDCQGRRKLAADLNLPYEGPIRNHGHKLQSLSMAS